MKVSEHAIDRFCERSGHPSRERARDTLLFLWSVAKYDGEVHWRSGNWMLVVTNGEIKTCWTR